MRRARVMALVGLALTSCGGGSAERGADPTGSTQAVTAPEETAAVEPSRCTQQDSETLFHDGVVGFDPVNAGSPIADLV
ncbi:MAG TPA: hypothetical protein VMS14_03235, partial [Ilumatobacteraceae bacterium]|nr:hypothetical protein [Ilumatobacteraceae bacterium]